MTKLNRAALFFDNLVPAATLSATSSASSSTGVDKLKTFRPGQKWRSSSLSDQTIVVDLADIESVLTVLLWRHNLSAEATIRVRLSANSNLSSPIYDNTFYAWPSIIGWNYDGWNQNGYDGVPVISELEETEKYSAFFLDLVFTGTASGGASSSITLPRLLRKQTGTLEELKENADTLLYSRITIKSGTGAGQSRYITAINLSTMVATVNNAWDTPPDNTSEFEIDLLNALTYTENDGTYAERYVGITISDSTNTDGYMEAGWLGVGGYSQFTYDLHMGIEDEFIDPSQIFTAYDQSLWVSEKQRYRIKRVKWPALSEEEAKGTIKQIGRRVGRSKPIVVLPFVENSPRLYNDTVFGLLQTNPMYKQVRRKYDGFSYECEMLIREQT